MSSKIAPFDRAHTSFYSLFQFRSYYMSLLCNVFLRDAMLSLCVYPSVCPSICPSHAGNTKMAKRRITRTRPYDSAEILVFWNQRSPRNSTRVTPTGPPNRGEVDSNWQFSTNISLYPRSGDCERQEYSYYGTLIRNSYMRSIEWR